MSRLTRGCGGLVECYSWQVGIISSAVEEPHVGAKSLKIRVTVSRGIRIHRFSARFPKNCVGEFEVGLWFRLNAVLSGCGRGAHDSFCS